MKKILVPFLLVACGSNSVTIPDGGAKDSSSSYDDAMDTPDVMRRDDSGAPLLNFVTKVVSFMPGDCAGFGVTSLPDIVFGPPVGAGEMKG